MSEKELTRLIILGAGASVDCGLYPTGAQFLEIAEKILPMFRNAFFNPNACLKHCLSESCLKDSNHLSNQDEHPIETWLKKIIQARPSSIDSYISSLSEKNEQEFLRSLILSIIVNCTSYSEAFPEYFSGNWYFAIWQLIFSRIANCTTDEQRLARANEISAEEFLKIITFNYDVSLEFYLWQRIRDSFEAKNLDKAKDFFKTVAASFIIHPYRQILEVDQIVEDNRSTGLSAWIQKLKGDFRPRNTTLPKVYKNIFDLLSDWDENELKNNLPAQYSEKIDIITDPSKAHLALRNFFYSSVLDMSCFFLSDKRSNFREKIKVIGEERKDVSSITKQDWDVLYVLGYGFDQANNKLLSFDKIKKYKLGCFVTNFEGNERLQRLILDELLSQDKGFSPNTNVGTKDYFIPYISHKSVSKALKEDFSLLENPSSPLKIQTNLTPYLAMRNASLVP
jgi:hypothetical protein